MTKIVIRMLVAECIAFLGHEVIYAENGGEMLYRAREYGRNRAESS